MENNIVCTVTDNGQGFLAEFQQVPPEKAEYLVKALELAAEELKKSYHLPSSNPIEALEDIQSDIEGLDEFEQREVIVEFQKLLRHAAEFAEFVRKVRNGQ